MAPSPRGGEHRQETQSVHYTVHTQPNHQPHTSTLRARACAGRQPRQPNNRHHNKTAHALPNQSSRWSQRQGNARHPSRTRKLSLTAPMVLHPPGCGRVGHHRAHIYAPPPGPLLGEEPLGPVVFSSRTTNATRPIRSSRGCAVSCPDLTSGYETVHHCFRDSHRPPFPPFGQQP